MKKIKIALLSLLVIIAFTACTNNEPVVEEQQIEESESIKTALTELGSRFGEEGDVLPTENPAGNIVFDFCFDFVYPIDLVYNTGTTVTVNGLDELITVIINSNQELFVNGIAFPFDVEVYDEASGAIVVVTVNNEDEFAAIIENCEFDIPTCECTEEYDPVCVEISDPNGNSFTLTYPNACYAECDGFTENDFLEDCEEDYNGNGGFDCFTFNYPITVITDDGTAITVNSDEELNTASYNSYVVDFEYPFTVTTDEDEVVTINSAEDFYEVLDSCYDDYNNPCDCTQEFDPVCVQIEENGEIFVAVFPNECVAICEGFTENDFVDCDNVGGCDDCPTEYDPVCVEIETPLGTEVVEFFNACIAECEGYTNFVDCEDDNGNECTEEDYIAHLTECDWVLGSNNTSNTYILTFDADGTIIITDEEATFTVGGTWNLGIDPITGGYTVSITDEFNDFNNTYNLFDCEADIMVAVDQSFIGTKICD